MQVSHSRAAAIVPLMVCTGRSLSWELERDDLVR